ncbi:DNA (cytosine-5-)-methyltransferase [Mesorhizobium sp. B2-3-4]|uniref:DNA cytosine methyltransferase n=1 Tax=Mesorhizobium sp. B2-3-4 TaxID=2589959 RepID=UPI001127D7A9|nr:DNA (cytosine-5-)-methyltransferase [Mesorhizobium sp. B2-3-4]TPM39601.1 DNA (cytosine-5-)-methyltransferase [Mesorhizobium sp. B2-3-4]
MRFLSLCSGIEAASVAWAPMGWKAAAVAEIEAFPSAVLAHHYPDVPNLGDITKFKEWPDLGTIDLICGGTPCQSFSVAGLRKGLADPRGNLSLTFLAVVDKFRPRYVIWENVPGVLSSDGGRDFAAFLGGLGQLGYGWAFRVLDAQHVRVDGFPRAVPQRRRRVFVVGYLGDWRRAAAVLSEPESVLGNSPPRREAGQGTATDVVSSLTASGRGVERAGETRGQDPVVAVGYGGNNQRGPIEVATAVNAHGGPHGRLDFESETFITHQVSETLTSNGDAHSGFPEAAGLVAHSLRPEGFDAGEDGTGRGTPIVPIAIQERAISDNPSAGPDGVDARQDGAAYTLEARQVTQAVAYGLSTQQEPKWAEDLSPTLTIPSKSGGGQPTAVAFAQNSRDEVRLQDGDGQIVGALAAEPGMKQTTYVQQGWAVRRLMPVECERLQGFPDGYTDVPYRGKPAADGPRYKALGNSWAVNVARWVGRRIEMVEQIAVEPQKERAA